MRSGTISLRSKSIVDSIRDRIRQGDTKHEAETPSGWRYGGEDFTKLVDSLQVEIDKDLQNDGIHVNIPSYHFPVGSVLSL